MSFVPKVKIQRMVIYIYIYIYRMVIRAQCRDLIDKRTSNLPLKMVDKFSKVNISGPSTMEIWNLWWILHRKAQKINNEYYIFSEYFAVLSNNYVWTQNSNLGLYGLKSGTAIAQPMNKDK